MERKCFSESSGESLLKELVCSTDRPTFEVLVSQKYLCLAASAALLPYLNEERDTSFLPHTLQLDFRTGDGFLMLDPMTIKCLELVEPNTTTSVVHRPRTDPKSIKSLFDVLNHTITPQGARFLKFNLLQPPTDVDTIRFRQSFIQEVLGSEELYFGVSKALLAFGDIDALLNHFVRASTPSIASKKTSSLAQEARMARQNGRENSSASHPRTSNRKKTTASDSTSTKLLDAQRRVLTILKLKRSLNGLVQLQEVVDMSQHPFFLAIKKTLSHPDLVFLRSLLAESMADITKSATPSKRTIQKLDVIFALKEGLNGLLDAARKVHSERLEDIQLLLGDYIRDFPELNLQQAFNASRGYFLRISESSDPKKDSETKGTGNHRNLTAELTRRSILGDDSEYEDLEVSAPSQMANSFIQGLPEMFILRTKVEKRIEFTTEDLVALNVRLTEATNEVVLLTSQLLESIQQEICQKMGCLYKLRETIALLDMLLSFATFVTLCPEPCCCPSIFENGPQGHIQIVRGFHPIILAQTGGRTSNLSKSSTSSSNTAALPVQLENSDRRAVPNNVRSSKSGTFVHIITGRNNSGKTTFLLQTASLIIMAHMGCYIPAASASICTVDRILSRITHQDNVIVTSDATANSSAFYHEMSETAYILASATPNSLVLLDEIGKSTSSEDGLPICFAVCEDLIARNVTTFFATHFLELASKLEEMYAPVLVHRMTSDAAGGVQHQLREGCEEDSGYGLELAAQAGWPRDVIETAFHIKDTLRKSDKGSLEDSRRTKIDRLQRNVLDQLRYANSAGMDSLALHVFLHKLAVRFREKMNELLQ